MSSGLLRPRRKKAEMNLLPLIDVLTMLIFFSFVTMQFRSASTLHITLPKVESAGKNMMGDTLIVIAVDKEGVISYKGKPISDDQLVTLLKQAHDQNKDTPILIKADEMTALKKVTFIMDACSKTGMKKFSLQSR